MRNKGKKALCLIAAITMFGAAFSGCGDTSYQGDDLSGYVPGAAVESNGGFAVKQGDFVYFINGSESYTANNTYGKVVKGALMRISTSDLASGNYDNVKTVVPSLFSVANIKAGVYILGDYVYYATPTTNENIDGEVKNTELDFKYAKLDGSGAPSEKFLRISTSTTDDKYITNYRFVSEAGVDRNNDGKDDVFCLYEMTEDGAKYAELDYKVLERTEKYSLAEVRLHTGRTHQIRVQMAGISHPVFGDMRYGGALAQKGKLALWAYSLSFTHPITKERMKFVAYPSETETPWKEFKFNDLLPVKA